MIVKLVINISLVAMFTGILGCSGEQQSDSNTAVQLFDGKTFTGWEGDMNW